MPHDVPSVSAVCDWEHGLCSFTQDATDDFDWTRQKGSTPSVGTGPTTDKTLQTDQGDFPFQFLPSF